MISVGILVIFALAAVLAIVPVLTDRWAVRRGASPQTLAVLALLTLVGIAALPVTFALCTGSEALQDGGQEARSVAGVAGLLLVALAAGRTLACVIDTRRRSSALSRIAATLDLPRLPGGVRVLPVGDLLALVSGSEVFLSQGLLDRLSPAQRRAVIEHEREHVHRHHARLLGAARALSHCSLGIALARRATVVIDRKLNVLADRGAAARLGETRSVCGGSARRRHGHGRRGRQRERRSTAAHRTPRSSPAAARSHRRYMRAFRDTRHRGVRAGVDLPGDPRRHSLAGFHRV